MLLTQKSFHPPSSDCPFCPRLAAFREQNRIDFPAFFNAPVPSFGSLDAQLLIVGLAPGLKGANRTGRPFTGDYAGIVLYPALLKAGLAAGKYEPPSIDVQPNVKDLPIGYNDGLKLKNCRITNAARCVPPQNKPEIGEIKQCNLFLQSEIAAMPNLKVMISLGGISHAAILRALGRKLSAYKFAHGAEHDLGKIILLNSYHTSRYNINTGALTVEMFEKIIDRAKALIC